MAALSTIALFAGAAGAAGGVIQQSEAARSQKKDAKRQMDINEASRVAAEKKQVNQEKVMNEQTMQRKQRERMRARQSAASGGRQDTILGGAAAGNTGNQVQAGAGKTLLGV